MSRLFDRLLDTLAGLAAFALAFIAVAICYEVFSRQVLNLIPAWVNDITAFILLAVTFAGGAYVLERDGHTRVDILIQAIPDRPRALLDVLTAIFCFIATAILAAVALYVIVDNYERGTRVIRAIRVDKWIVLVPIFVGSALVSIKFLQITWRNWQKFRAHGSSQDNA